MASTTSVYRSVKRRRLDGGGAANSSMMISGGGSGSSNSSGVGGKSELVQMIEQRRWDEATKRASNCPEEVSSSIDPSPLALACRSGAPYECIRSILEAEPVLLRHVLDSRGTPLHEAISSESGPDVIEVLLKTDKALGEESTPATLLQDVDGFTPLHLLIRRRFEDDSLMSILEMLVSSCPEAVVIPDRGEYEEPPIVYALKANIYSPSVGSEDAAIARVEQRIFEMVACMLRHYPDAASRVFNGYRGQYTALHSAVFHGRYTSTIELLLRNEAENPSTQQASLLANTQGELPLHFSLMRGERPRSVALIAKAAPAAVLKRDASGLTPFHWLWIRFLSTLLALDGGGRGGDTTTISIDTTTTHNTPPFETSRYNEFTSLERGDFDADLQLFKRLDPPVDFLRMRHIPREVLGDVECLQWATRSVELLGEIRERHHQRHATPSVDEEEERQLSVVRTRQEVVVGLFWTKVVSLLEASMEAVMHPPVGDSVLVHTAMASPSCPPSVAYIVASLFPEELTIPDSSGRLPIHFAAGRPWHAWDWPRDDGVAMSHEPNAAKLLLQHESFQVLRSALEISPPGVVKTPDGSDRLVLHHAIDTFVGACSRPARSKQESPLGEMVGLLSDLVKMYPESLFKPDGRSGLIPFLQATATASDARRSQQSSSLCDELPLTITYLLLREDPTALSPYSSPSFEGKK